MKYFISVFFTAASLLGFANDSEEIYSYDQDLANASKFVAEQSNQTLIAPNPPPNPLGNRFYKTGDKWRVSVIYYTQPMSMNMDGPEAKKQKQALPPEVFDYTVRSVNHSKSEAVIDIKQANKTNSAPTTTIIDRTLRMRSVTLGVPIILPDISNAFDLFSRPIKIVWKDGDLWPSLIKAENSESHLLSQHLQGN